ncbi:hypothetical protein [Rhizobium tubonense]|uniref:hypothetical protein n=1 Tax=Rhizobium tubonense TaxID=484088 RepID=UPI0018A8274B|nr:hypothetical protein [Rhizobium tubonense]
MPGIPATIAIATADAFKRIIASTLPAWASPRFHPTRSERESVGRFHFVNHREFMVNEGLSCGNCFPDAAEQRNHTGLVSTDMLYVCVNNARLSMTKQSTSLVSARIDESLKRQFVQSAELNRESPSEALRHAIQNYVREARKAALENSGASIRANASDETDVLNWIAAHSVPDDQN